MQPYVLRDGIDEVGEDTWWRGDGGEVTFEEPGRVPCCDGGDLVAGREGVDAVGLCFRDIQCCSHD